jgi:hypothetical protein
MKQAKNIFRAWFKPFVEKNIENYATYTANIVYTY